MNKTEPMVLGFPSPVPKVDFVSSNVDKETIVFHPTGTRHKLGVLPSRRFDKTSRSIFLRWDRHNLGRTACRAALDCLTMTGCVLLAALVTLFLGL